MQEFLVNNSVWLLGLLVLSILAVGKYSEYLEKKKNIKVDDERF